MALRGTLKDFSVADIFQLIGQQQKSGSLSVRTKEEEISIIFDKGNVVIGTFKKGNSNFLLGTMLLRAELISKDQLDKAINNQRSTLRSIGDILISSEAITPRVLSEFVALQAQEVLFQLLRWNDGFYEFVTEELRFNKSLIKARSAESVLMTCFQMLDEWPGIIGKVGSMQNVFVAEPAALKLVEKDAETNLFKDEDEEDLTSQAESSVIPLLDGMKTLQEAIHLSRQGTFETCKTVAHLLDRGLAKKADRVAQTKVKQWGIGLQESGFLSWIKQSSIALFLFFLFSVFLSYAALKLRPAWEDRGSVVKGKMYSSPSSLCALRIANERQQISRQLEIYFLSRGRYPSTLEMAIDDRRLPKRWQYQRKGSEYLLAPLF